MSDALAIRNFNQLPALSTGSLDAYITTVNNLPMLTDEEEKDLGRRVHEHNDLEAAQRMILSHLRFVVHVARSYSGYGLPLADLIQEGNVGLMKAVKRFDPGHGVRLVSFAVHWVRAEIHEFVLRNWRIVKVATTKAQRKLFFNLRSAKERLGWFTHDEAQAVAKDLGVEPSQVVEMESRLSGRDIGFDPLSDADDDDKAYAPAAYLSYDQASPEQLAVADDLEGQQQARLYQVLKGLDERSRDIISRRWLSEGKATLHELAAEYGVSAERIRQIEANALKKMRSTF